MNESILLFRSLRVSQAGSPRQAEVAMVVRCRHGERYSIQVAVDVPAAVAVQVQVEESNSPRVRR